MEFWTGAHLRIWLPTLICEIGLAILLGFLLKGKSKRVRMIPILVITVILWMLEIGKQIYGIAHGYDLQKLPLYFCSLFLYLFIPFVVFGMMKDENKGGKFRKFVDSFTVTVCAFLFFLMILMPTIIYGEGCLVGSGHTYLDFHTVAFHNLVVFAFLLILSLKLYNKNTKLDMICLVIGVVIFGIVVGSLSNILKTDFNNFYECFIDPIENIRLSWNASMGWFGQFLYDSCFVAIIMALCSVAYWFYRLIVCVVEKIQHKFVSKK